MGKPIARVSDTGGGCGGSGVITSSSAHWLMRGQYVALHGDTYQCSRHGQQRLIADHPFTIRGKSIVRQGDRTTCGATIYTGGEGTESGL